MRLWVAGVLILVFLSSRGNTKPKWLLVETKGGEEQKPVAASGKGGGHQNRMLGPLGPADGGHQGRILGGSAVQSLSEAPWQVVVQTRRIWPRGSTTGQPAVSTCGGTLVSQRHIITAAHCIYDWGYAEERHPPPSQFFVFMGQLKLHVMTHGPSLKVRKVSMHPRYHYFTFVNDIVVLELEEEVDLSEEGVMKAACLPDRPLSGYLDKTATVSGFGATSATNLTVSPDLKILSGLQIYDKCPDFPGTYEFKIENMMMCAGGEEDKDTCQGDSGGPLWVTDMPDCSSGGTLLGVTSWGHRCGLKGVPGVYTDVYKVLQQDNFWLCKSLAIPDADCPASKKHGEDE